MGSMMALAAAATVSSRFSYSETLISSLPTIFFVALSMVMTPMLAKAVPVDWMASPFGPAVMTVWEWPSMMKSMPCTFLARS